jgi:hypothetical protein
MIYYHDILYLILKLPTSAHMALLFDIVNIKSKKSRPHLDVERGWSGANEHFPPT